MKIQSVIVAVALVAGLAPAGDVVVLAGRILDPISGKYTPPSAIVVRENRIAEVIPRSRFKPKSTDSIIDLSSMTILPGLIDAHVHLGIGGTVANNARADLDAGFTTVANLGALTNRMLRLRDSINAGFIAGPRVLSSGRWIGTQGGVCEFNGLGISGGPDAFRQRVKEDSDAGADLIKVCVSGWPAASFAQPDKYEIADSALAAVVTEAHARGKRVVAHDISSGGIRAGIKYGIDGLAHTGYLDDELARELARSKIYMITTLTSLTRRDTSVVGRELARSIGIAQKAKVQIVFGTDGGVLPHGRNAEEFLTLARAGLSALDGIRAATVNAAAALGIQDSVGMVVLRMSADMIAVEGDPLADLSVLQNVKWVMLRGRVVK